MDALDRQENATGTPEAVQAALDSAKALEDYNDALEK